MKRKRLTKRQLETLMKRQGGKCATAGCETVLIVGPKGQHTNFIDEHDVPLGLKGSNALKNRSLRCIPCAKRKTFGTKATTAGSDIHSIRKGDRIRDKKKFVIRRDRRKPARPKRQGANRAKAWPPSRKMQSRGFQKRGKSK